jgi:hypothetical protein
MVGLLNASEPDPALALFCGGVVIAPRRVLTAGHCVIDAGPGEVEVLVGRTRLTTSEGRRVRVRSISVYPGMVSGRTPSLDAAVLTLREDAGVVPLALARPGQDAAWAPGTTAWTLGWGRLNARDSPGGNSYYADRLRELQTPVQGDDACEGVYGTGWIDFPYRPAWLLCSGTAAGGTGTCSGDSGGPLVVAAAEGWLDVGIDEGGDACAARGYYDVYARVDRVSAFALEPEPTAQPYAVTRPRIVGRLVAGAPVRCRLGRWRGHDMRYAVSWRRVGSRRVVGHGRVHRVTVADAARGLRCAVTASNRGGRRTVAARPLRPPRPH